MAGAVDAEGESGLADGESTVRHEQHQEDLQEGTEPVDEHTEQQGLRRHGRLAPGRDRAEPGARLFGRSRFAVEVFTH